MNLKIMNFDTLFGDEIHEDDYQEYQYQDDYVVKVVHTQLLPDIKGIIKQ